MDDFFDIIMDLTFDHEGAPTGELLTKCLEARPDRHGEIVSFFECWVWQDWCEVHMPPPPEPTAAAAEAFAQEALRRFEAMMRQREGGCWIPRSPDGRPIRLGAAGDRAE